MHCSFTFSPRTAWAMFVCFGALSLHGQEPPKNPPPPMMRPPAVRREAALQAQERLTEEWREFGRENAQGMLRPTEWARMIQPKILSVPELDDLYTKKVQPFVEPDVIQSAGGKLEAKLVVDMAHGKIGNDPVYLRTYNYKLVGPTLRCKPGDTLYISVENKLPPEAYKPEAMNTLHNFNTTNMHFHGLHVSPSGNSDNVLLQVFPGATQKYEIKIEADHPCGTYWYHAHLHGSTAGQVGSGMAGAIIIEGDTDKIPAIAAMKERTFVLQQIPYVNNASKAVCSSIPPEDDLPEGVVEAEYADCSFAPRRWDRLGRFTTINGVKMPVIKIAPNAIERWRLVNAALREVIQPELVRHEKSKPDAPSNIEFQEIAVDGLPLGRKAPRATLELWPGYRSEVLVRAPNVPGARYVLRDTRVPLPGATFPEERRYLALVVVEGEEEKDVYPPDTELAKFRLPSIQPGEVTGRQLASYGLVPNLDGSPRFTVDRMAFGTDEARVLFRNDVDEWTLTSRNPTFGAVSHPFHIHVNPFEIYSILDPQGVEQLDRDPVTKAVLPVWRDTIILHEGFKVSFRTRYTHYEGVFVSHCHILDHEDQGMMELVEVRPPLAPAAPPAPAPTPAPAGAQVRPYPAPDWALPDAQEQSLRLSTLIEGPTLVVFFEGFGCLRCNQQIQAISERYEEFKKRGLKVVGVSTDTVASLKEALAATPTPFPIVADPNKTAFRAYGCLAMEPLHGAFLVDSGSMVRWQNVSTVPFGDFERIWQEAALLAPIGTAPSASR